MLEPWQFIIVVLCAYRVTRFFVYDSLIGFHLASRSKVSKRIDKFAYDQNGQDRSFIRGKIGDLLVCPFCFGFWVSVGSWAAWYYGPDWLRIVMVLWAAAGVQSILNAVEQMIGRIGQ